MRSLPLEPCARLIVMLVVLGSCSAANAVSFQGIGTLPGGTGSYIEGMSDDGNVLVGCAIAGSQVAIRWTRVEGVTSLGAGTSYAWSASADGRVIVGRRSGQPFRWTSSTGAVSLGDLPGGTSAGEAYDVSADGAVVVGYSHSTAGREAFCWTAATGMIGLGFVVPTSDNSLAMGIAGDASIIVGGSSSAQGTVKPVVWTSQGIRDVSAPPAVTSGEFEAVSANGLVAVGDCNSGIACRWTQAGGYTILGDLPGGQTRSFAHDVSGNGSVVVGAGSTDIGYEAFIWDAAHGLRNLKTVLTTEYGLNLTGWLLNEARAISADGGVIAGYGTNPNGHPEGWVAVIPEPNSLVLLAVSLVLLHGSARGRRTVSGA